LAGPRPNGERSAQLEAIEREIIRFMHSFSVVSRPLADRLRFAHRKRTVASAKKRGDWEIPKKKRHDGSSADALHQAWIIRRGLGGKPVR
jgi:hypothetical protein